MRVPSMPYMDAVLERLRAGDANVERAYHKNLHLGFWDSPAAPDLSIDGYDRAMDDLTRRHFTLAEIAAGQRVVDVGCGLGGTMALLNDTFEGLNLVGVNIDDRQLAYAKSHVVGRAGAGNEVSFVLADACQLPLADHSVDVVFSVECIFHFSSKRTYFHEVRRVLKPGGRLVVSDILVRPWAVPLLAGLYLAFREGVRGTYGECAPPVTRGFYRTLGKRTGLDLVGLDDVTRGTLPNYALLPKLVSGLDGSRTFERGVKFLEYATRLGLYTYDILTFRARS